MNIVNNILIALGLKKTAEQYVAKLEDEASAYIQRAHEVIDKASAFAASHQGSTDAAVSALVKAIAKAQSEADAVAAKAEALLGIKSQLPK